MAAVAALVASCTAPAHADGPVVDAPAERVGEFRSKPAEPLDAFLLRVGRALVDFSDRTQFEACGTIARSADGTQYAVDAYTNHAHVYCASLAENVPNGMVSTGQAIHSHPTKRAFHATDADRRFLGIQPSDRPVTIRIERPEWFSAGDYDNGPGYLATKRGVYFQEGRGGERLLGRLPVEAAAQETR
jgi:hypothetical protein